MRPAHKLLTASLAALVAALLTIPATAAADQRGEALSVLRQAESALGAGGGASASAGGGSATEDPTLALKDLALAYHELPRSARPRADRLLERPRPKGAHRVCGSRFCVHWRSSGKDAPPAGDSDADGVPDYVQLVMGVADYAASVENDARGWPDAHPDGRRGGEKDRVDIYIKQMPPDIFGYAVPNVPKKRAKVPHSLSGHLMIDKNFSPRRYLKVNPLTALEVTLAHEYNHVLQFGIDVYQERWMAESTATWMEDVVFPDINDYLRYMPRWAKRSAVPITSAQIKVYGSAVWNHWLSLRYGPDFVRDAWTSAPRSKPRGLSVGAYDDQLRARGGGGFGANLTEFAADTAEWRTSQVFPEGRSYPDVRRLGTVKIGGAPVKGRLSHTGYALLNVPVGDAPSITLQVASGRRVPFGIALVARGGPRDAGLYTKTVAYSNGRSARVTLPNPGAYSRITAVIVNTSTKTFGYDPSARAWVYRGDGVGFRARIKR